MAMDFSVKEAKQLIEQHKMLLSKLDYIVAKDTSIRADVRQSANDSIMQSALRRTIVNNCNHCNGYCQYNE